MQRKKIEVFLKSRGILQGGHSVEEIVKRIKREERLFEAKKR